MPAATELIMEYLIGKRRMPVYSEYVSIYDSIRVHANGEYPAKLIEERRPHESEYIYAYRKKLYKPITKRVIGSVIHALGKIRRSSDWSIKYDPTLVNPKTAADETLEQYCEKRFPYFNSLTNWVFSILLKEYLVDPNAIVLVAPLSIDIADNEYVKPFPVVINSSSVLEFKDDLLIVRQKDKATVADEQLIVEYEMTGDGSWKLTQEYEHNLGRLPAFKVHSLVSKIEDGYVINHSRIGDMIPELDEAVREYSDQQANIVNYLYPERWEYATQQCPECVNEHGISIGRIKVETEQDGKKTFKTVTCKSCGGSGVVAASGPFKKHIIRPHKANLGESEPPIPPFGYVTKDTEIIKVIDERIERHLYNALSAVNMQFLSNVPLNQSGLAKEVDKEELNNFIYTVAEDLVMMMDKIYELINDYRYSVIVPSKAERDKMLPVVAVPERFDVLSSQYLMEEIKRAHDSKLNPLILTALDIDLVNKKFYDNQKLRDELISVYELDPLSLISDEEKMVRLSNGGITKEDYVISCNILQLVRMAMEQDEAFMSRSLSERKEQIRKLASIDIISRLNKEKEDGVPAEDIE
jgi:hypothetical protein